MKNDEWRMLGVVVEVELLAQEVPVVEEFLVVGGIGDAYQQAVIAFGFDRT